MPDPRWAHANYVVKERRFTLGRQYRVFDPQGRMVAYCKQKMMRLKEDIRFFADEGQETFLFGLKARKVLDFNAALDVLDAEGRRLGGLRRKGWRSMLRDEWHVLDSTDRHVAILREDSSGLAFLRRFGGSIGALIPYHYHLEVPGGTQVADIDERFQLFGDTYDLRLRPGLPVDPRVLLGLTVLVDALEGQ